MQIRDFTDAEGAEYRARGVAYLPGLADAETVAVLKAAAERRALAPSPDCDELSTVGRFLSDQFLYRDMPEFQEFVFNTVIARNAGKVMGVDRVRLYFDHLFLCAPQTPVDYYWHQDIAYWPIAGDEICSVWLCLTDCTRESSALQFVLGTDKRKSLYAQSAFGDEDLAENTRVEATDRDPAPPFHERPEQFEIVTWDFCAGDAVLFNTRIMHSSGGNHSQDVNRIAYSTRWIGDNMRFAVQPGWQDPLLFPDEDEGVRDGDLLTSRKFPLVWAR